MGMLENSLGLKDGSEEIYLTEAVTLEKSTFDKDGGMVDWKWPRGITGVILCGNKGGGLRPYRVLLPHQIYLKDLKRDFADLGWETISAIPYRSYEGVVVAARSKEPRLIERWSLDQPQSRGREYRFTGAIEENVRTLTKMNEVGDDEMGPVVEQFMMEMESVVADRIKVEIAKRDDEWEKRLSNVRAGLR